MLKPKISRSEALSMGLVIQEPENEKRVLSRKWVAFCDICGEPYTPIQNGFAMVVTGKTASMCYRAECREKRRQDVSRQSSQAMKSRLANGLLERMKTNNPMKDPVAREKVANALRQSGHKPPVRGGNGEITKPQAELFAVLGEGWTLEHPILTGLKKGHGEPTSVKVDIAHLDLRIAIEVDGGSHGSLKVQEQDRRKEAHLSRLGWSLLRFKNRDVNSDLQGVVARVQELMSSILKSRGITTTLQAAS